MTAFAYEIASVLAAQHNALPNDSEGAYALPWYLVLGDPSTGRSAAVRAINLSWPYGDGPLPLNAPQQLCTYWMPAKAVFIEPEGEVLGPNRRPERLRDLCQELMERRPREPIDGAILVINAALIADCSEDALTAYAKTLRGYLVEVGHHLHRDLPIYIVITALDTLWGFGDAFAWNAERQYEQPWGFTLPVERPGTTSAERFATELDGLQARLESSCFAKISSEGGADSRMRAFQHLAELRALLEKLGDVLRRVTMNTAFEQTPWIRALILGSGIPGTGDRLRCNLAEFTSMGMYPPARSGTLTPGGMPIHALLDNVLIPERDIVPLRTRWRDDWTIRIGTVGGIVVVLAAVVAFVLLTLL